MHHTVKSIFGIDLYERTLRAEAETTYLIDGYFIAQALFGNEPFEFVSYFVRMRRKTARAAAKNDVAFTVRAREFGVETLTAIRAYFSSSAKFFIIGVSSPSPCTAL